MDDDQDQHIVRSNIPMNSVSVIAIRIAATDGHTKNHSHTSRLILIKYYHLYCSDLISDPRVHLYFLSAYIQP